MAWELHGSGSSRWQVAAGRPALKPGCAPAGALLHPSPCLPARLQICRERGVQKPNKAAAAAAAENGAGNDPMLLRVCWCCTRSTGCACNGGEVACCAACNSSHTVLPARISLANASNRLALRMPAMVPSHEGPEWAAGRQLDAHASQAGGHILCELALLALALGLLGCREPALISVYRGLSRLPEAAWKPGNICCCISSWGQVPCQAGLPACSALLCSWPAMHHKTPALAALSLPQVGGLSEDEDEDEAAGEEGSESSSDSDAEEGGAGGKGGASDGGGADDKEGGKEGAGGKKKGAPKGNDYDYYDEFIDDEGGCAGEEEGEGARMWSV